MAEDSINAEDRMPSLTEWGEPECYLCHRVGVDLFGPEDDECDECSQLDPDDKRVMDDYNHMRPLEEVK